MTSEVLVVVVVGTLVSVPGEVEGINGEIVVGVDVVVSGVTVDVVSAKEVVPTVGAAVSYPPREVVVSVIFAAEVYHPFIQHREGVDTTYE